MIDELLLCLKRSHLSIHRAELRFPQRMGRILAASSMFCLAAGLHADFGLTADEDYYTIDTDAGLVFKVRRIDRGSNTQSPGDIASLVYKGVEYQNQSRGSQINSGFDWLYNGISAASVSAETVGNDVVKVTVTAGDLTHYYIARRGDHNIYMGTHFTTQPNVHGLVRYIMRMPSDLIPDGPIPSDIRNNTGAIESADIFGMADGTTRSKHYSGMRQMDWRYTGASGPGVGVWMVKNNEEGMSGGPFYRCLIAQTGGDQEVYAMINYGEAQTDVFRPGILNLYTFAITDGETPGEIDVSWMDGLNLLGYVPASSRGTVTGQATGIPDGFEGVVGFSNATAQYWAVIDPDTDTFACPAMIPGIYKATLYKGELEVATQEGVEVTAGGSTPLNIASAEATPSTIFRIGEWDGTPKGFMNADKITVMHPTDVRMEPWGPITYVVGQDPVERFPSAEFRLKNSPTTVQFELAPNQVTDLTIRIGITCNYAGGRPTVSVNNTWNSSLPAAPIQPGTRTITVGTYRGNNTLFSWTIPASALKVGTNTLTITPISGTSDLGAFLSASYVFDAVELNGPIATPAITYVGGDPLMIGGTAEPGRTITLMLDGVSSAGTTTVAADGTWAITYPTALGAGDHSWTALASDGLGHDSPVSSAYAIDSDMSLPSFTAAQGDTGSYAGDASTSDRVFVFSGTATPGASVQITRVGVGVIGTVTADGSGNWSFDYSTVSLPDGANVFFATVMVDGQASRSSAQFVLNLAGAPRVAIERGIPAQQIIPSTIGSIVYRVTFNHPVQGVTPAAFAVSTTGSATATVSAVSASSGTEFDVTVDVGGVGNVQLTLSDNNGITNLEGQPEAQYLASQPYTLVLASLGNGTWIQTASGGLWSDPANWDNAVIADGESNTANFASLDLESANTAQLDTARSINQLIFGDTATNSAANWTLGNNGQAANVLTMAGTNPTITVNGVSAGTGTAYNVDGTIARIDARLAGINGLVKSGAGTLVLGGANSMTGTLGLNTGYVELLSSGTLALGTGAINLATNTQLQVRGNLSTSGLVTNNTGLLEVHSGTVNLGSYRTAGNFGATLRLNEGTLNVGSINITRNAGANPDYNSGVVVRGGSMTVGDVGLGTLNSTGNLSIEGGAVTATGPITIAYQASGGRGGALRVTGGTFISTDTTYGLLLSRKNGSNANNVAQAIFTGGTSSVEKITLGYDSTVDAGSGTVTLNGGTLYLGSGGIVKNGAATMTTSLNLSSGTLGAKANWSTSHPINLPTGGSVTLRAADAFDEAFDITLDGPITGAGDLIKNGEGTLTLAGASTGTGSLFVEAGTLQLTGSLASGGTLVLGNAATLRGNGTINKDVILNGGEIVGTPTLASLLGNGGTVVVDAAAGPVTITGALSKGSDVLTLEVVTASIPAVDSVIPLLTFGSTDVTLADVTLAPLNGYLGHLEVRSEALVLIVTGVGATAGYTDWAYQMGLTSTNRAPALDADHDGVDNLIEFYQGTDPLNRQSTVQATGSLEVEGAIYPTFTYQRRTYTAGVTAEVQAATDLEFTARLGTVVVSVSSAGEGLETVVVRTTTPIAAEPVQFLRLVATLPVP